MANQSTTADLVIRAKDIQVKPLEDLLKILKELEGAQKHLSQSGKLAETSMRELTAESRKFDDVAAEISRRRAAVDQFQALTEKSKALTAALMEARQAKAEFEKSLPVPRARTDDQKESLKSLRTEAASLKKQFDSNAKTMESTSRRLQEMGMDANNLAAAERHLAQAQASAQAGADQAVRNTQNYSQALRDQKKAAEELAAAKLKAKNQEQAEHDLLANREAQGRRELAARGAASGYGDIMDAKAVDAAVAARKKAALEAAAAAKKLREEGAGAAKALVAVEQAAVATGHGAPAVKSLSHEIAEVLSDSEKAKYAIDKMGAATAEILARQDRISRGRGTEADRSNLAGDRGFLLGAQREVQNQAKAIETAKQAAAEVQRLSTALGESKSRLEAHARAASTATAADDKLSRAIAEESKTLNRTMVELARARTTQDNANLSAHNLGINFHRLAEAEETVRRNTSPLVAAVRNLSDGNSVLAQRTRESEQATTKWGEAQRTSLTLVQRLRSEVLQLTLAYVGIHGVMAGVKEVLDVDTQSTKFKQQMSVANKGDLEETKRDMEFVRWEADRLGLSFKEVADGYGKFNISARFANFTMRETQDIFQGFGEAFRVFGMSSDQVNHSLLAIEQMMSKGRITAEEFRRQLANFLPGLEGVAATAMGVTTAKFNEMMSKGELSIRNLMLFAQEYQRSVAPQLAAASKTWQSEFGRAETKFYEFKQAISDNAAFKSSLQELGIAIQKAFGGDESKDLATNIAELLARIVHEAAAGIPALVSLMKDVTGIMAAIAGGFDTVNKLILDFGAAIRLISPGTKDFTKGTNDLAKSTQAMVSVLLDALRIYVEYRVLMMAIPAVLLAVEMGFTGIKTALVGGSVGGVVGATSLLRVEVAALEKTMLAGVILTVGEAFYTMGTKAYDAFLNVRKLGAQIMFVEGLIPGNKQAMDRYVDYTGALDDEERARLAKELQEREKNSPEARRRRREAARQALANGTQNPANARAALRADDNRRREGEVYTPVGDYKPELDHSKEEAAAKKKAEKEAAAQIKRDQKRAETEAKREREAYANNLEATKTGIKKMEGDVTKRGGAETDDDVIARAHSSVNEKYTELAKKLSEVQGPDFAKLKAEMDRAVAALQRDAAVDALLAHRKDQIAAIEALRDAEIERVKAQEGGTISAQRENAILEKYNTHILDLLPDVQLFAKARGKLAEAAQAEAKYTKMAMEVNNNNGSNKAKLADYQEQLRLMIEQRDAELALAEARSASYANEEEKNRALEEIRAKYNANILDGIAAVQKLAREMNDKGQYAELLRTLDLLIVKNQELTGAQKKQIKDRDDAVKRMTDFGTTAYDNLAKVALGQEKMAEGWYNIREAFKGMLADYLHGLAQILIKKQALATYDALFGKTGEGQTGPQETTWLSTALNWAKTTMGVSSDVKHDGGVVGGSGATRNVAAATFARAQKFHGGGLPGLSHDEIPAILKKREEVLSENDPRNILNGGGNSPAGGGGATPVTIHNLIDSGDMLASGVGTPAGQKAVMNFITANRNTIKKLIQ